jgi:PAS domain S-box-containing protein
VGALGAVFTYALLTVLWGTVLALYLRYRRTTGPADPLAHALLGVLALDAFKSFFESVYFGIMWSSNFGVLPTAIGQAMGQPGLMTAVKWLNVVVAALVLMRVQRDWIPTALALRHQQLSADVQLHTQLEASLREARQNEERAELALQATNEAVWEWRANDQRLTYSPRFRALMGYDAAAWPDTYRAWFDRIHPEDQAAVRAVMDAFLAGPGTTNESLHRVLTPRGYRMLRARVIAQRDASGRATRMVGSVTDLTESLAADEARAQRQKLESVGLLAGGVAHDFNNLLAVIRSNLALAADPDSARTALAAATEAAQRAALLTRRLLTYGGRARLVLEPIDLSALVRSLGELLTVSMSKKVRLEEALSAGLPPLEGDAAQLQQVVMNLITNASEAIGDREGVVRLETRRATLDAQEARRMDPSGSFPGGDCLCLSVSDTGQGMSPEVRSRVFDPFFTTKDTGRGLGLSALTGIVRSHKGCVELDTVEGQGSTFRVWLPARPDLKLPEPQRALTPAELPAICRVLVVDDEPMLRRATGRQLKRLGCVVEEASNGQEALERLAPAPKSWDVVVMDVSMPVMDGREALLRMRAQGIDVPVILASGYSEDSLPDAAKVLFLPKPFEPQVLEAALKAALALRP